MPDEQPSVAEYYDALSEGYEQFVDSPVRSHLEWPSVRRLLPGVSGLRVLDAGCGPGVYSGWLAERGAEVVGVDASEEMVRVARERRDDVAFHVGDFRDPLAFVDPGEFDLVVSLLTFSHLPALEPAVSEFARALGDDGTLVVSTHHPFHDYLLARDREHPDVGDGHGVEIDPEIRPERHPPQYPDVERLEVEWVPGGESYPATYHRRPLSGLLGPITDAGFALTDVAEPDPDEDLRAASPAAYEAYRHHPPETLALRAER